MQMVARLVPSHVPITCRSENSSDPACTVHSLNALIAAKVPIGAGRALCTAEGANELLETTAGNAARRAGRAKHVDERAMSARPGDRHRRRTISLINGFSEAHATPITK